MSDPRTAPAGSAESAFERVRLLLEARRPQDALRIAQDGLAHSPGDPDLVAAVAWASLEMGDASSARSWAEYSLGFDPANSWVHHLRAIAILDGAGKPEEARSAVSDALHGDPHNPSYLYTLVRACLACRDRQGAEQTSLALQQSAPASHLRPLAAALIELDKGRVYLRREYSAAGIIAVGILTRGAGLVILAVAWLVHVIRRAPHLRRADGLLNEALRLRPDAASIRTVASEVLRLRFRFAQSVDYELAAAAIDTGLVDADELAQSIARRTTAAILTGFVSWVLLTAIIDNFIDAHTPVAAVGVALAISAVLAVGLFHWWQTRNLPKRLVSNVNGRGLQPAAAAAAATFLCLAGSAYLDGDVDHPARGYHLASLVSAPIAVLSAVSLIMGFIRSRVRS